MPRPKRDRSTLPHYMDQYTDNSNKSGRQQDPGAADFTAAAGVSMAGAAGVHPIHVHGGSVVINYNFGCQAQPADQPAHDTPAAQHPIPVQNQTKQTAEPSQPVWENLNTANVDQRFVTHIAEPATPAPDNNISWGPSWRTSPTARVQTTPTKVAVRNKGSGTATTSATPSDTEDDRYVEDSCHAVKKPGYGATYDWEGCDNRAHKAGSRVGPSTYSAW